MSEIRAAEVGGVSEKSPHFGTEHFFRKVQEHFPTARLNRILIVGCGPGEEVPYIRRRFNAAAFGFDLDYPWMRDTTAKGYVMIADAHQMPFLPESFDAVFAHHVLEHVGDEHSVVRQIFRVLRPGGVLYVGVPNKRRVVSLGITRRDGGKLAKLARLIECNVIDYRDRLQGRWDNHKGAHAGFTLQELHQLLGPYFEQIVDLTGDYLRGKYARWPGLIDVATYPLWLGRTAPSRYLIAVRRAEAAA